MTIQDDLRIASYELGQGVPIKKLLKRKHVKSSFLLTAAARNNLIDTMRELIEKYGADVHGRNVGEPPIIAATDNGSLAAVKFLIDHGADVNVRRQSREFPSTALWTAADHGDVRVTKALLDAGADVNAVKTNTGTTPLFMAVQNGHKATAALLINHGADLNKNTPIIIAVGSARLALVAQLINAGAEIPTEALFAIIKMKEIKKTITGGYTKKVTEDELKVLKELVYKDFHPHFRDPNYIKAKKAERNADYHAAFRYLIKVASAAVGSTSYPSIDDMGAQFKFDLSRNLEAIYGVRGSDGRMSDWSHVPIMSQTNPESFQYNAWARVGRRIYVHGGVDFCNRSDINNQMKMPKKDELWQLNIDTREWSMIRTNGETPGPRTGHSMFAYKNAIYVWGGKSQYSGISDSRLYRLNLDGPSCSDGDDFDSNTLTWEIVKYKNPQKPPPREDHASVLYRGKYYITGGTLANTHATNDLWCLDMSTFLWTVLKSEPTVERYSHGMWAGNGKLYVFGGRASAKHISNPILASHTVEDFVSYDIEANIWRREMIIGDRPFDISEFTVLPLYHKNWNESDALREDELDPTSIIVCGGYTEIDRTKGPITQEEMERRYGDLHRDFQCPYRKRTLRFDLKTEAWTLLEQTRPLLPKAQLFAAELRSENGQTKLLVGGGYGVSPTSMDDGNFMPEASNNLYEINITDERDMCVARDDLMGKGWAWDFRDCTQQKLPTVHVDLVACSPTLHQANDLTYEDFLKPPCDSIQPNNSSKVLGIRVKLHGLKGRKDLNGKVGRCGIWHKDKERYQVFLPMYERGGLVPLLTKASNLCIADPLDPFGNDASDNSTFPSIRFFALCSSAISKSKKRRPLDFLLSEDCNEGSITELMDMYHGPVSAKAQVILRTITEGKKTEKQLLWMVMPTKAMELEGNNPTKDMIARKTIFNDFYSNLKDEDSLRVAKFEAKVSSSRVLNGSSMDNLGSWMKLVVTLDGITPPVRRELLVSPDATLQSLHNQVLCPSVGWINNYHCYAFRRIHGGADTETIGRYKGNSKVQKAVQDSLKMMSEECWIGPKTTTAIDSVFQPLYIGGAMANAKSITLGDLFLLDEKDEMYLQYVHDFGDWWSHTICVTKYNDQAPPDTTVAHLLSGEGICPPEDIGGIEMFSRRMSELTGRIELQHEEGVEGYCGSSRVADPSSERWWELMNKEVRGKHNGLIETKSPTSFDLEAARTKLGNAIRHAKQKGGHENLNSTYTDFSTGLSNEFNDMCKMVSEEQKDPLKFCAVCDVTMALKVCGGCNSVAFCSREHQLEYWPKHKKECRRIKKERNKQESQT